MYKFKSEGDYLFNLEYFSNHLNVAVAKAILEEGKLPEHILSLEGMSSHGNRLLLNNLCHMEGSYLEIGSWKGSTFISALYNNPDCVGTSIDSHQEFKNSIFKTTAEELENNCKKNLVNGEKYELITADCFSSDIKLNKLYDIYFYDGWHSYEDQYNAIKFYYNSLKSFFYYICDDYSIERVEKGTKDAFRDLNIQVITEYKLFGNQHIKSSAQRGFWNGIYVALCVKKNDYPEFFRPEKYTHCFDSN